MKKFNHKPSRIFTNKGKVLFLLLAGFLALSSCTNFFMERLFQSGSNTQDIPVTVSYTITVEQMTDLDDIDGGTIFRNGNPTSISFAYMDTGSYTCEWSIDGVGAYAGTTVTGSGSSFTVDAKNEKYNSLGRHAVYLDVEKDGVPYRKTIWVEIVDFEPVPAIGVTLNTDTLSLVVGGTETLSADFEPDNATNRNVTWSSNNDAVATVTGGVVSAVSVGNATITVTTEDGDHTANCAVKVSASPILVSDLTLNKSAIALAVGGTETLSATVAPADATDKAVNWSISPSGVARVTNGSVTGIGAGSATVTVTTADGNRTASCVVTVTVPANINEVDFGPGATVTTIGGVNSATLWNSAKTTVRNGGNDKNYIINITGNFTIPGSTDNTFAGSATGIKVSLRGAYTLSLTGTGNLIRTRANQTVILRDLTLQGRASNDNSVVYVSGTNSAFVMQSGKITGNTSSSNTGGGVYVGGGTFTMNGGEISGNTATGSFINGGGVFVSSGTFTMNGGKISSNTATYGGGVSVNGTFTMNGGEISGNTDTGGGGVRVGISGTFTMNGGEISVNTTSGSGGGVYVASSATFTMNSGKISGNTATTNGGGVYMASSKTFTMQGGEISGNKANGTGNNGGGGVYVNSGTFCIVTGTIYGSNATPTNLRNTASGSGAALNKGANATAQRGTFSGATWNSSGDLVTTNDTVRVVEGELQ